MKKTIIAAFLIGTAMPFLWLWLALAMFNAKGLDWLDYPMMITTPFWWCDWSYKGDLRIMPLNGLLYAAIMFAVIQLFRKIRQLRMANPRKSV